MYFCLEVLLTDRVPFLQSTVPFIFPVYTLRLHSAFSPILVLWAILLCLSSTLGLQTTVPSASYQLTHHGFLSLPGSYWLENRELKKSVFEQRTSTGMDVLHHWAVVWLKLSGKSSL